VGITAYKRPRARPSVISSFVRATLVSGQAPAIPAAASRAPNWPEKLVKTRRDSSITSAN